MANPDGDAEAFEFPILIGDIGGTNARFAVIMDAASEAGEPQIVKTANFSTIDDAIQSAVLDRLSVTPRSAVIAVAGPVDGARHRTHQLPLGGATQRHVHRRSACTTSSS